VSGARTGHAAREPGRPGRTPEASWNPCGSAITRASGTLAGRVEGPGDAPTSISASSENRRMQTLPSPLHLTRFHGVFAPDSTLRAAPQAGLEGEVRCRSADRDCGSAWPQVHRSLDCPARPADAGLPASCPRQRPQAAYQSCFFEYTSCRVSNQLNASRPAPSLTRHSAPRHLPRHHPRRRRPRRGQPAARG
jgi:hypothetical protein